MGYGDFCSIRSSGSFDGCYSAGSSTATPRVADRLAPKHDRACDDSDSTLRVLSRGIMSGE
jgi:hypothetical protein